MKAIRSSDLAPKVFRPNNNKVVKVRRRANETIVNLFKNNKSRNSIYMSNIKVTGKPTFSTPNTKKIFNYLQETFIKAPIL